MAYPTSASEVGLTVAKSSLNPNSGTTTLSGNFGLIEGQRYDGRVVIANGAVGELRNVWFANVEDNQRHIWVQQGAVGTDVTLRDFEVGISAEDGEEFLGGDGSWDSTYGAQAGIYMVSGEFQVMRLINGNIHHVTDGIWPAGWMTVQHCLLHDFVLLADGDHSDGVQIGFGVLQRFYMVDSNVDHLLSADSPLAVDAGAPDRILNRAVWIKPDLADIGEVIVHRSRLDSEGFYVGATFDNGTHTGTLTGPVVWDTVTLGSSASEDVIEDQTAEDFVSHLIDVTGMVDQAGTGTLPVYGVKAHTPSLMFPSAVAGVELRTGG